MLPRNHLKASGETKKVLLLLNAAEAKRENEKKQAGKKKEEREERRNMGNCLAPFQLTGQSNLFHVMALFTCLTKLRARHPS